MAAASADFPGTVVAVTHDRYFLDNVAGWILELDRGEHGLFACSQQVILCKNSVLLVQLWSASALKSCMQLICSFSSMARMFQADSDGRHGVMQQHICLVMLGHRVNM